LNQKHVLWASSKKKLGYFQRHNILASAYKLKHETSTSSTYVSLVFCCTVRS
jgi:hypothetical protein